MNSQWREDLRVFFTVLGELMITMGVFIFLFAAWQLWWTDLESSRKADETRQELQQQWAAPASETSSSSNDLPATPPDKYLLTDIVTDKAFALLHVPRFGEDWEPKPILGGTSDIELARGIGFYEGTQVPGEVGNFAIAGHRTTYGRPFHNIDWLEKGDPIVVETGDAWFTYRMEALSIVDPSDVGVIAPVPNSPGAEPTKRYLTMTACHPKFSAKERIIAHAVFDTWQPKSAGRPDVLASAASAPPVD